MVRYRRAGADPTDAVSNRGFLAAAGDCLGLFPGLGVGAQPAQRAACLPRAHGDHPTLRRPGRPDLLQQSRKRAPSHVGTAVGSSGVVGLSARTARLEPCWPGDAGCEPRIRLSATQSVPACVVLLCYRDPSFALSAAAPTVISRSVESGPARADNGRLGGRAIGPPALGGCPGRGGDSDQALPRVSLSLLLAKAPVVGPGRWGPHAGPAHGIDGSRTRGGRLSDLFPRRASPPRKVPHLVVQRLACGVLDEAVQPGHT